MLLPVVRIFLGICLLFIINEPAAAQDHTLTVYVGRVTEDRWLESLSLNTELMDAYLLVGAWSSTVKKYFDGDLTLEIEVQAAKYFGDQDHLEFNVPVALRWHSFLLEDTFDTSVAFGIGPSWAAEDPRVELMTHESTRQLLVYWFLEFALGPPDSNLAGIFRLHHRSTGFGTVAKDGGSNTLAVGVRFRL